MSTAAIEKQHSEKTVEAAKASLRAEFALYIEKASDAIILNAATLKGDQALVAVLEKPKQGLSVQARNQIAITKMKARAFESLSAACHLLDANEACNILGISRQALGKKAKAGNVLAYTNQTRKYYPDFQFADNKVISGIKLLVKATGVDVSDESQVNILIQFLAQTMDYSNPGEDENLVPRYSLLGDSEAFKIIIRDYKNRLEMGK